MNKNRRKLRKAKSRVVRILFAPYYLTHWFFSKVMFQLKKLFKYQPKLQSIINGWSNYVTENPASEGVAMYRAKICSTCPHIKKMIIVIKDKKLKDVQGMKCGKCNCPLSAKTRSLTDYCPIGKWV